MKKNLILGAFLGLALFSCDNETEQGPLPVIDNYVIEEGHEEHEDHARLTSEEDEIVLIFGEEAIIEADLSGQNLSNVQLDIHWAGDGHEHRLNTAEDDSVQMSAKVDWQFGVEGGLTPAGVFPSEHHLHEHIDLPLDVNGSPIESGEYHFVLHLWDQEGNATQVALTSHLEYEGHDYNHE